MLPRLYLETTVPSYLAARPSDNLRLAADQSVTIEWWERGRASFDIFVSVVVLREISRGDPQMAEKRLSIVEAVPILDLNYEAEALAEKLLRELLPPNAADDAAHIAIAAAHSMDFLLTWNCKHINNRYTIRRIEKCCSQLGMVCPVIATPAELMSIEP